MEKIIDNIEGFFLKIFDKIGLKFISNFYRSHQEGMRYLVFGALTTLVSILVKYMLLFTILDPKNPIELQTAVIISWICACLFAYYTNRIAVFKSKTKKILKELISFFAARIITLLLEMGFMGLFITVIGLNTDNWVAIITLITQILVIIANYILSKLFVFKK